jgi:release factor glutamine methyltransferase
VHQSLAHRILRRFLHHTYRPLTIWYLRRDRSFSLRGIRVVVKKGVFHPGLFFSTRFLIDHLEELELEGKRVLELGAGTGMISLFSAARGAQVTASDISNAAIENIRENAQRSQLPLTVIRSDLFDALAGSRFDLIVINPPYYAADPRTESDFAWYGGKNLEYFHRLFAQLAAHIEAGGIVRMVLSSDCRLDQIEAIAHSNGFSLHKVAERAFFFECNTIFDVGRSSAI